MESSKTVIPKGVTVLETQELAGNGDRLRVAGTLAVEGDSTTGTAVQVTGTNANIVNLGTIDGSFNGINFANGGTSSGTVYNFGRIISDSRAINIGGQDIQIFNYGEILTSADPRDGVIYADETATSFDIFNGYSGLVDVGEGNNGDAISLELGAQVAGSVTNHGLVQGRGDRGVANANNRASGIRLYWGGEDTGADISLFQGDITNYGTLTSETDSGVLIENRVNLDGTISNYGTIDGALNGVEFGNGGLSSGNLVNYGLITSASRSVNIGGQNISVENYGKITASANPRDGVVYADQSAPSYSIFNGRGGVIDVGEGNHGDAISLQLAPEVDGSVVNEGIASGRGNPVGNNRAAAIRLRAGDTGNAVFNGDIINEGTLTAENDAAIVIQEGVGINGSLFNGGTIYGGLVDGEQLAIDARGVTSDLNISNEGAIYGDILLGRGNDVYDGSKGNLYGAIAGGDGDDLLTGGLRGETLEGGRGSDELRGGYGFDVFRFGSDIFQDGLQDVDIIQDFNSGDTFDFDDYLQAGGQLGISQNQNELLVSLSGEDTLIVRGNLEAAEQQLLAIASNVV